jgi:hypothetical protein
MNEECAVVFESWPQPNAGAPMPLVNADEASLYIRYRTAAGKIAVVYFQLYNSFTFGSPNDEALSGHRLFGRGLTFYSVHRVENSSWIARLEQQNSAHPNHNKAEFLKDLNHYIFTFHDSTLECVVNEGDLWPTEVSEFTRAADAAAYLKDLQV